MPWQQLKIHTSAQYVDQISDLLNLFDAVAVTWQDNADEPLFEPAPGEIPLWTQTQVTGLFDVKLDLNKVLEFVSKKINKEALINYQIELVPEQDWERVWMKDFHAMQFGKRLWICPSNTVPPDPTAVNILLDPGLAFGTGTHATTALCLEWLDAHPPQNKLVIDYGCGSGILAIAALKLNAREVWAVDHDPQALEATQDNAERNQIDKNKLHTIYPEQLPSLQADVLIANILAKPIIELAVKFVSLLKPNGDLVLSGILENQVDDVIQAYQSHFKLQMTKVVGGWVRLEKIKN